MAILAQERGCRLTCHYVRTKRKAPSGISKGPKYCSGGPLRSRDQKPEGTHAPEDHTLPHEGKTKKKKHWEVNKGTSHARVSDEPSPSTEGLVKPLRG